jgi:hypothetical protein
MASSKILRPAAGTVEDPQDLDSSGLQPIRHNKRRARDYEFACSRHASWPSHLRVPRQQRFNIVDDVQRDALRGRGVVLLDVGTQRRKIVDRLR